MPTRLLNGVRIHYDIVGEGEPLVFLNGVMMTTQSWVLQTSVFRRQYSCVLHDFRGQLLSEKPDQSWTLEDHVDDLRALLDHLELASCHVVGTSYGGEVGLLFALAYPDRVKSLSMISSVSEVGPELDRVVAVWSETALESPDDLYRVSAPSNFSPQFVENNRQVIEQGETRIRACPPEFFIGFAGLVDAFRKLDVSARLDRIACPTLVLVGELDALKEPRYSRLMADRIPGAEFLMVPGAGHAVIIEKPAEVNTAIMGFLAKHA